MWWAWPLSFSFLAPWNNLSKVFVWTTCIADSDLLSKSFWDWWLFLRRHRSSSLSPQGLCLFVIFKDYYLDENKVRYNFKLFYIYFLGFSTFFVKKLILSLRKTDWNWKFVDCWAPSSWKLSGNSNDGPKIDRFGI